VPQPTPLLPAPATRSAPADCRCACGSLLARVVGDRLELKCRRCKRTLLVPLPPPGQVRRIGQAPEGEAR